MTVRLRRLLTTAACLLGCALRRGTLQVLVFVFFAMPAFAEDGGGYSPILVALCVLVMMASTMWFMYRAYENSRFGVRAVTNDSSAAIDHFKEALNHASVELLIHDDGDKDGGGGLYNNKCIIDAVRTRLTECEKLKIRCLLNFNAGVEMTKLSHEFGDRFSVRYLKRRPSDDVHFKIADRGRWAYLSTHALGAHDRNGEICDGTQANRRVQRRYVGDLIEAFEDGFKNAHKS